MRKIKELFSKALSDTSTLSELELQEIKFSQKTSTAIMYINIDRKINPVDVSDFTKKAKDCFSLNDFKLKFNCVSPLDIEEQDVFNIIEYLKFSRPYLSQVFDNGNIDIGEDAVTIELKNNQSGFLKLKKVDELISSCIKGFYGVEKEVNIQNSPNFMEEKPIEFVVKREDIMQQIPNETKKEPSPNIMKQVVPQIQDNKENPKEQTEEENSIVILGRDITKEKIDNIEDLNTDYDKACIAGKVELMDIRELKSGKKLLTLDISDRTSTIATKMFLDDKKLAAVKAKVKEGTYVKASGKAQYDPYAKELTILANNVIEWEKPKGRMDTAETKRVELHMHTQMSAMDGVSSCSSIIKNAIKWGHKAVAITDHGVVQAFPEAHHVIMDNFTSLVKKEAGYPTTQEVLDAAPIKVLYGVEGYLVQDIEPDFHMPETYVVFDIETTGLDARTCKITEIAACKVKNGEIVDEFSTFVNPECIIPKEVQELTHITPDMVKDAPTIEEILPKFLDFISGSVLVAHNAKFDVGFIRHFANEQKIWDKMTPYVMDTLVIARELYPTFENHKLGTLAENLGVTLEGAHRAINDTRATVYVMLKMLEDAVSRGIDITGYVYSSEVEDVRKLPYYHIIIFAKNYVGLKNLYRLISYSHVTYFNKRPRISRSMLNRYKEGLLIGSACESGELYQAIFEKESPEDIEKIANYYDYLEVQPLGNNKFYTRSGRENKNGELVKLTEEELKQINIDIVNLGDKLNKPVVATCDVHFLNPEDEIYRRIIMAGMGFDDADEQAPLYFRTTEEMLKEFDYLPPEKAYEIVVTNTNLVADMCDRITPISDEKCPPHIDGCEETIRNIAESKAHELYGDPLPDIVHERLEKELDSIIKNGFSVMYIIAQKLVWKSNEDGYLVGSRGSVGSSFVANMTGITEVNSLKAHYRCKNCKYSDFSDYGVKNGFDLPDKNCPVCGEKLEKDGMDIPFETFLGFNGDKEPDIDLNFSGDYQAKAHKYTEVIFGKGTTYKAGTIGTVADKTAYGFVLKYLEERNKKMLTPEINRIARGCTGIKRTSGQHPGGIIVVPKGREIYEFCPVQHPADDPHSNIVTTHFDYHSIDKNLLKLDILGHDDPTVIRMLQDLTGVDPKSIPLDDKETMSIFSSTDALGVTKEEIHSEVGTYGVPEFGTKFVRGMLVDTKPTTFEELIRISGLSHGTDVWLNNAQTLIENGTVTLSEAICTRDDIMIYLMDKGLPPNTAFKIMESVRKGKVAKGKEPKWPEYEALMKEHGVPDWYIDSCKKIMYMFPKAHAAAYVTMAFRIAWFKVHIPSAYYAAFFSIRADEFDADSMLYGEEKVLEKMKEIDMLGNQASQKEKGMYPILEIVLEMNKRHIKFLPIDLYKSDAKKFLIEDGNLRPPLSAIPNFGEVNADNVIKAREEEPFASKEDLTRRAKLGKSGLELLEKAGCLNGMPNSLQVSLFDGLM